MAIHRTDIVYGALGATSLLLISLLAACATPPAEPDEVPHDRTALLDEPVSVQRPDRPPPTPELDPDTLYIVPQADREPNRTIDGQPDDWDLSQMRHFRDMESIREGAHRWSGPDDASFGLAVDADDSFLYFFIDVTDDRLIRSDPEQPKDAVVIWLRDPAASEILTSLPETLQASLNVRAETAIAITPDRRVARYGGGPPIPEGAVHVGTTRTDTGYTMEVAIGLEAMPIVRFIPLVDIAFRVELLDSDSSESSGPEKILTMLPPRADGVPRFAVFDTGGLLPHTPPDQAPPRSDAMGYWQQIGASWSFRALEYISPRWLHVPDRRAFFDDFRDYDSLPDLCHGNDHGRLLLEAFQSARGDVRVGLMLCGSEPVRGQCPSGGETQVVWFAQRRSGDSWRFDRAFGVFPEPLKQCPTQGFSEERFYSDFSMLPLDVVGSSVWAVGWHAQHHLPGFSLDQAGVTFVDPRAAHFIVGTNPLRTTEVHTETRRFRTSRVFLTDLNDQPGLDICEIEEIQDQRCRGFGTNCQDSTRGYEILTHIKTWNAEQHRLEDYILNRHPRCRASQGFEGLEGYELLLLRRRLGLLPGPSN